MVTQKAISLKIDTELLKDLDKETSTGWMKRNTHINQAIALYLELQDVRRRVKCYGNEEDKKREANKWLRKRFPEIAEFKTWRLRHGYTQKQVAQKWGCSRYTIMRAEGGRDVTWEMAYRLFARLSDELRKEGANG